MSDSMEMRVAKYFSATLRDFLTPEQMIEVLKRNADQDDPNICHTHDFCDANEVMADALKTVAKRTYNSDAGRRLWDKAWKLAKHNGFFIGRETPRPELSSVGCKVMLRRTVERYPHALVIAGNTGTIHELGFDYIEVKLDKEFPGLKPWDNCLVWSLNEDTLREIGFDLVRI